jgi:hypothetical protein
MRPELQPLFGDLTNDWAVLYEIADGTARGRRAPDPHCKEAFDAPAL